jgi:hypothetical protein
MFSLTTMAASVFVFFLPCCAQGAPGGATSSDADGSPEPVHVRAPCAACSFAVCHTHARSLAHLHPPPHFPLPLFFSRAQPRRLFLSTDRGTKRKSAPAAAGGALLSDGAPLLGGRGGASIAEDDEDAEDEHGGRGRGRGAAPHARAAKRARSLPDDMTDAITSELKRCIEAAKAQSAAEAARHNAARIGDMRAQLEAALTDLRERHAAEREEVAAAYQASRDALARRAAEKRAAVEACFARFKAEMRAAMAGGKGAGELLGAAEAALERRQEETREAHAAEVKKARRCRALRLRLLRHALVCVCMARGADECVCAAASPRGAGEQEFGGEDAAPGGAVRAQAPGAPRAPHAAVCVPFSRCVAHHSRRVCVLVVGVAGGERREGGKGEGAEGAERAVRGAGAEGTDTFCKEQRGSARGAGGRASCAQYTTWFSFYTRMRGCTRLEP